MDAARPNMTPERKYPAKIPQQCRVLTYPGRAAPVQRRGRLLSAYVTMPAFSRLRILLPPHELGFVAGHTGRETHLLVSLHLSYTLFMSCPARALYCVRALLYCVRALCPVRSIFPPALSPASVKSHVLQKNHTLLEVACVALNSSHAFSASSCAVMGRCASSHIMLAMIPIGDHFLRLVMCTIVIFQCLNVT